METGSLYGLNPRADDNAAVQPYAAVMTGSEASPHAGSAHADAQPCGAPATRWMRPLGVATTVVIVGVSLREDPAPALSGNGLPVALALVAFVASITALLRSSGRERTGGVALFAMIVASCALIWTQRGGPGVAGLFIAAGYAATRLSGLRSLTALALAVVAFAGAAAHANRTVGLIAAGELGIVAFYLVASFARRAQLAQMQTTKLLVELETSRHAEDEAAALRERSRIAREIHDVLAHSLSGLMLQLEGARMLAAAGNANGQLPAALDRAHHLASAGLAEARHAIGTLRDEDLPGPDRLERLASDFSRDSNVETTLAIAGNPHHLDSQTSLTLFRVAQEALTNSRKHAQPHRVELQLAYEPAGTRLVIQDHIGREDAAVGGSVGQSAGIRGDELQGYGLTGMRERAELLGGRLQARPTSDGFRVELWIPA